MRTLIIVSGLLFALGLTQAERGKLFKEATHRLKETGIEKRAPRVGESFPDLVIEGKKLSDYAQKAGVVVTFYRGGWCPYCMQQLKELSKNVKKFGATQVLALTPEEPEAIAKTKRKNSLELNLLHDKNNDASRSLGIAFQLEPAVADEYRALGIPVANPPVLPLAATFVLGTDLKVVYAFVNADYTQRAALLDVLKAVENLKARSAP